MIDSQLKGSNLLLMKPLRHACRLLKRNAHRHEPGATEDFSKWINIA